MAKPADPEHIRRTVDWLARELGWTHRGADEETDEDRAALDAECPHCHAGPGRPCARQATRGKQRGQYMQLPRPHPSRVDLIKEG